MYRSIVELYPTQLIVPLKAAVQFNSLIAPCFKFFTFNNLAKVYGNGKSIGTKFSAKRQIPFYFGIKQIQGKKHGQRVSQELARFIGS